MKRPAITDIPLGGMPALVREFGLKKFAANQIITWLYRERVSSFDEMTNISKPARAALAERFVIDAVRLDSFQTASDGTRKYVCRATDGAAVECVFIPSDDGRNTVCISTQVGCAMGCSFCRTAQMGLRRNLTQGEIIGQLICVMRDRDAPITNVVLMGMGEPLMNLTEVSNAVEIFLDHNAFGLSKRRVTLSTCGILDGLKEFAGRFGIKIAISLNATTDEARARIMPVNKKYPIAKIMEFCREYSKEARYRVTFEYILMHGVNDGMEDAERLVKLLKDFTAKVNLIPYNAFEGSEYKAPSMDVVERFADLLRDRKIQVNIRESRGREIMAACGQLAANSNSKS